MLWPISRVSFPYLLMVEPLNVLVRCLLPHHFVSRRIGWQQRPPSVLIRILSKDLLDVVLLLHRLRVHLLINNLRWSILKRTFLWMLNLSIRLHPFGRVLSRAWDRNVLRIESAIVNLIALILMLLKGIQFQVLVLKSFPLLRVVHSWRDAPGGEHGPVLTKCTRLLALILIKSQLVLGSSQTVFVLHSREDPFVVIPK